MHWFLDPLTKHYADFTGRATRQQFWMYVLIVWLIQVVLNILDLDMITTLLSVALLIPNLAIGARRLHDIGKSGWWQLLMFIPIIGWIILIVWFATKSDTSDNQFGSPVIVPGNPVMTQTTVLEDNTPTTGSNN